VILSPYRSTDSPRQPQRLYGRLHVPARPRGAEVRSWGDWGAIQSELIAERLAFGKELRNEWD